MTDSINSSGGSSQLRGRKISVGVIGDYQASFPPHPATDRALKHAAAALGVSLSIDWLGTAALRETELEQLAAYDALWCAPGSPYKSMAGALRAIRLARELDLPLLGTCGGFQHMVLEYARNVLGIEEAQHAEYDPYASDLFISQLTCSLAGRTMTIGLSASSGAAKLYGKPRVRERYYCNFGLNPSHQARLEGAGLEVVGIDQDGEARVVELPNLRFYLATLFVPQLTSRPKRPHPLVLAFLKASMRPARSTELARTRAGATLP